MAYEAHLRGRDVFNKVDVELDVELDVEVEVEVDDEVEVEIDVEVDVEVGSAPEYADPPLLSNTLYTLLSEVLK